MDKYDSGNVFAKVIRGELPCSKVYEDELTLAFNDIYPAAPVHVLVIPKKPYISYSAFVQSAPEAEMLAFFHALHTVIKQLGLEQDGYRLITNHGIHGMQTVPHFHMHILGGKVLGPLITGDHYHNA